MGYTPQITVQLHNIIVQLKRIHVSIVEIQTLIFVMIITN